MTNRQWVRQVKSLLFKARQQHSPALGHLSALRFPKDGALNAVGLARRTVVQSDPAPAYAVRRRHLMAQVRLKAKHYGLADEIRAFVCAAGFQVLQELENDQLEALHTWLARGIDNIDMACDSALMPPAR